MTDNSDYVNVQPLGSGLDWARRLALGLRHAKASRMPDRAASKKLSPVTRCGHWPQISLESARGGPVEAVIQ